jgi:hypothetical protein
MWENEVEQILEKYPSTKKYFIGALSFDEFPKKIKYPCCFVLNTQPRSSSGEHWLALHYNSVGFCTFFDSYAKPPETYNLNIKIQQTSKGYKYNNQIIQGDSFYCGHYCILFLIFKCLNKENNFFKLFSSSNFKNDLFIKNLLNK